ncbi:DUF2062 domain-containing protein [Stakelama pacifica]|uniref:DUF2062 domain-containing protein n=1 Tax=Stakelama pacifica TaxID=517720 RepID=A0A4V3BUD6_9SPHN|nr:DUF2062 domain-containing protein [Stakelama pacifica]TDN86698.1 hypothetical protein EV664_101274 [Stakelama pacifica]GGO90409.1 hypothetical protein GCM10011329_02670 [Stakelama pacifica]
MNNKGCCATEDEERAPARTGLLGWLRGQMPTRAAMARNKWLRPVAHRVLHPALWRFTRRSVPRGVALGMLTGFLTPVAQIPLSALLAFPIRANIPAAALTTFVTNPLTMPPIWLAAYWTGKWVLSIDANVPGAPIASNANLSWFQWLLADAGPATVVGLVLFALSGAILGYAVSALGWRLWIARKWKRRRRKS